MFNIQMLLGKRQCLCMGLRRSFRLLVDFLCTLLVALCGLGSLFIIGILKLEVALSVH